MGAWVSTPCLLTGALKSRHRVGFSRPPGHGNGGCSLMRVILRQEDRRGRERAKGCSTLKESGETGH